MLQIEAIRVLESVQMAPRPVDPHLWPCVIVPASDDKLVPDPVARREPDGHPSRKPDRPCHRRVGACELFAVPGSLDKEELLDSVQVVAKLHLGRVFELREEERLEGDGFVVLRRRRLGQFEGKVLNSCREVLWKGRVAVVDIRRNERGSESQLCWVIDGYC